MDVYSFGLFLGITKQAQGLLDQGGTFQAMREKPLSSKPVPSVITYDDRQWANKMLEHLTPGARNIVLSRVLGREKSHALLRR